MDTYLVGIDGGGTKTTAKIVFHSGRPPVMLTGGPLNICSAGKQQVAETISQLAGQIESLAGPLQNCTGIGIGAAGITNLEAAPFLKACTEQYTGCKNIKVYSDAYIALCGALAAPIGVILIAGTGSICHGVNSAGTVWRTGGVGHLIDDEGSGYAVGRDILTAAVKAMDGRGPDTVLLQMLGQRRNLGGLPEIISFTYAGETDKSLIAALAPLLTDACGDGDEVALEIARRASDGLLEMADTVIRRLSLEDGPIAFRGSILQKEPFIIEPLTKKLRMRFPNLTLVSSGGDAVDGALFLVSDTNFAGFPQIH